MPNLAIIGFISLCIVAIGAAGLGLAAAVTAIENFYKTFE